MDYEMFTEEELDKMFMLSWEIINIVNKVYPDEFGLASPIEDIRMLHLFEQRCIFALIRKQMQKELGE